LKSPVLLRIYFNDKLEGVRQFVDAQIVIGRNPEAQVNLPEEGVSPLHAVIEERESGYYVSDLGSQSGTFKNGQKVLDEPLASGDEVKIGPYKLQFFIGVPKPAAPPSKGIEAPAAAPAPAPAPVKEVAKPAWPAPAASETPKAEAPKIEIPKPAPKAEAPKAVPPPAEKKEEITFAPASSVPPIIPRKKAETKAETYTPPAISTPSPQKLYSAGASGAVTGKKGKKKTFAPPSAVKDPKEILKPGKGTAVEVSVAWRERIISTNHFTQNKSVMIGSSPSADVFIPLLSSKSNYELFRISGAITLFLSPEMTGEFINEQGVSLTFSELLKMNRLRNRSGGYELVLNQGEMVRVGLQGDLISIYIRYVPAAPKPLVAPLLDLTASEVTGVVLATFVAAIFGLYMMIYAPTNLQDEDRLEEQLRKATVTFNPPIKKRVEVVEQKVEVTEAKPKAPEKPKTTATPSPAKDGKPGKAAEVAPKETKDKQKKLTSARPGGAIKTGNKEAANMKSQKPDPNKQGLLGVFGSKGTQEKLDKAYSGSGELIGMADTATGAAGSSEDRPGDRFGTKIKDTGAGGKGTATVGISGVGTQGKGTGYAGSGTGGIGTKGNVEIEVGGQEAEFTGSMDREAIRRVIQANYNVIRFCYEKALERDRDLYGKLVLEWDIAERGRVTRAIVKSSTLNNSAVASCIIARLKTWTFPEPPPNQIGVVAYPFVFTSQ
jgi:hypothetical protein